MTARQMFEGALIELSKVNAPSMLLSDFNYFINKAINQYINKRYNIYDVSLLTTDDLRVLKATAILPPVLTTEYDGNNESPNEYIYTAGQSKLFGATYEVILPDDYLHMLNCICIYKLSKNYKCYNKDNYVLFPAKRLTSDAWSIIVNDYYNRPLPERPYYYIHNVNNLVDLPTNISTDMFDLYSVTTNGTDNIEPSGDSNFPRTITLKKNSENRTISTIEREASLRYGNASKVRCEIRYGRDNTVFVLDKVFIDYIKAPLTIRLTLEQVDLTEDTSQIMEFPDYVCQEITNELVTLLMENTADPRLQTHAAVTLSIANPVQQLKSQS